MVCRSINFAKDLNERMGYQPFAHHGQVLINKDGTTVTMGSSADLKSQDLEKLARFNKQTQIIRERLPSFVSSVQSSIETFQDTSSANWYEFINKLYVNLNEALNRGVLARCEADSLVPMEGGLIGVLLTALRFTLGVLQVLPLVAKRENQEEPSISEITKLIDSGAHLNNEFAKLHLGIVKDLQFDLQDKIARTGLAMRCPPEKLRDHNSLTFKPDYFAISDGKFGLSSEFVEKYHNPEPVGESLSRLTFGCPAKFVMFDDANQKKGVNGITYIFKAMSQSLLPWMNKFFPSKRP